MLEADLILSKLGARDRSSWQKVKKKQKLFRETYQQNIHFPFSFSYFDFFKVLLLCVQYILLIPALLPTYMSDLLKWSNYCVLRAVLLNKVDTLVFCLETIISSCLLLLWSATILMKHQLWGNGLLLTDNRLCDCQKEPIQ